nr:helicase-related protein [Thiococcus pfennigii]
MIATDAACGGLNLQTLGTLINVDLPWNPTRLEQRIERIKRFGQARAAVDMLNLVHQGTVDETVYARLSERMRNRYDLFSALPDTIRDDWIDDIETLGARMDQYIEARRRATGFDLRYNDSIRPSDDAWRDCATVLARRDVENLMRQGWGGRSAQSAADRPPKRSRALSMEVFRRDGLGFLAVRSTRALSMGVSWRDALGFPALRGTRALSMGVSWRDALGFPALRRGAAPVQPGPSSTGNRSSIGGRPVWRGVGIRPKWL